MIKTAGLSLLALAGLNGLAMAEGMKMPAPGSVYKFDCTFGDGTAFTQEYRIEAVNGDRVTVAVRDWQGEHRYSKPYFLTGSTLFNEMKEQNRSSRMEGDLADFSGLSELPVGYKENAWIKEVRRKDDGLPKAFNWNYTLTVTGRENVYNRAVGDSEIYVIQEERWVEEYSSKMFTHYAPAQAFPLFWQYEDSNGVALECRLSAVSLAAIMTAATKGTPAASAPDTAVPVTRLPAPRPQRLAVLTPPRGKTPPATVAPRKAKKSTAERIARLDMLLSRGLITKSEYDSKKAEIMAEQGQDRYAIALADLSRKFRQKEISPDAYIKGRAALLAEIAPDAMKIEEALAVLKRLFERRLISEIEYARKRQEFLDSI